MPDPKVPQSETADVRGLPEIRYENASQFRVIHCDGAFGELTPNRLVGVSLYTERFKPPDRIVLHADEQGNLSERPIFSKREVIRQLEATVLLSMDEARNLASLLLRTVGRMEENE